MAVHRGAVALAGAAATLVVLELFRRRRRKSHGSLPPGRRSWPVIGETLQFVKDPQKFFAAHLKEFGGSFYANLFLQPNVILEPTESNFRFFTRHHDAGWPRHFKQIVGRSAILTVNDPMHKRLRSVYGRSFSQQNLDKYLVVFQELTRKHLSRWAQWGEARETRPAIKLYTFEVAQRTILGAEFSEEQMLRTLELFDKALEGLNSVLPINLPGFPLRKALHSRQELVSSIYQPLIDSKRAQPAAVASSMLDHAMAGGGQEGGEPSDEELQDLCFSMAFAGHDTTLASMQSLLHFLSVHPAVHEELRAEVDAAWDGQAPVTRALLQQLHKVRAFVLEALRHCVPVQGAMRQLNADAQLNGWVLPAGTTVMFATKFVTDARFPDADDFNIKRYLDQDGHFLDKATNDYASVALFGLGNRMCLGYRFAMDEMFVFLLNLLHGFDFKVEEHELHPFPFHYWRVKVQFSVRCDSSPSTAGK